MSWRITRSLSRRLRGLRLATLSLAEERLPDVVARLERGEKVDVESATPPLDYGTDELGQVAQAFNTAQRTACTPPSNSPTPGTASRRYPRHRPAEPEPRQHAARQAGRAGTRTHRPEILKGLYELDSTASQLRRYEENLVIIAGEQPGAPGASPSRWWTSCAARRRGRPVPAGGAAHRGGGGARAARGGRRDPSAGGADAGGADRQRDRVLPAPHPVGVRAALVAKGLAVEIEDRGWGCRRRTTPRSTPSWRSRRSSTWWRSRTTCGSACSWWPGSRTGTGSPSRCVPRPTAGRRRSC